MTVKNTSKINGNPVGKITLAGKDISEYIVVYPPNAGEKLGKAVDYLQKFIEKAVGVKLEKCDDKSAPDGRPQIVLGRTNKDTDEVVKRRNTLSNDGYLHFADAENNRVFISGATERGTLQGTVCFPEDRIGCRFFTNDCQIVKPADEINIPADLDVTYNPTFDFRCSFYKLAFNDEYNDTHKLRGIDYANGQRVHTFGSLAEMTGDVTGKQPCMTDEKVYQTILKNVKSWLRSNPDATVISVSQNDSYEEQLGCQCENCKALNKKYGTEGGALFELVNRVARDIKDEFPDVLVETLAYRYSIIPPKGLNFEDNVLVQICIMDACYTHTLDDPNCPQNYRYSEYLENWSKICKHLSIWDYHTNFAFYNTIFPNYYVLYDHITYYSAHNVKSVFNEANYNSLSGHFEELRSYICSQLLWNPQMTREEYDGMINEFLQYYYGDGWEYVRRFMDLTNERACAKGNHYSLYTNPGNLFADFSFDRKEDRTFLDGLVTLFDKALQATDDQVQRGHIEKSSIQALYFRQFLCNITDDWNTALNRKLYELLKKYGIDRLTEAKPMGEVTDFRFGPSGW